MEERKKIERKKRSSKEKRNDREWFLVLQLKDKVNESSLLISNEIIWIYCEDVGEHYFGEHLEKSWNFLWFLLMYRIKLLELFYYRLWDNKNKLQQK